MITTPVFWILISFTATFFGLLIGYAVGFYIGSVRATEGWAYNPCWKCGELPRRWRP